MRQFLKSVAAWILKIQDLFVGCDLRVCQAAAWPDKGIADGLTGSVIADGKFLGAAAGRVELQPDASNRATGL